MEPLSGPVVSILDVSTANQSLFVLQSDDDVACFNVSVLADGVALSGWGAQSLPLVSLPTAQQASVVLYQVTVVAVSNSGVSGPMANVSWTLTDTRVVGEPNLSISTHQAETVLTWALAGASLLTYAIDGQ